MVVKTSSYLMEKITEAAEDICEKTPIIKLDKLPFYITGDKLERPGSKVLIDRIKIENKDIFIYQVF